VLEALSEQAEHQPTGRVSALAEALAAKVARGREWSAKLEREMAEEDRTSLRDAAAMVSEAGGRV
jgi:hypothetical protein